MNKVRTHIFNGRKYTIVVEGRTDGCVDKYSMDERFMMIMTDPHTKNELETFIHESLHAENWAATEKVVERVGRELADFLWRLGFRRVKK